MEQMNEKMYLILSIIFILWASVVIVHQDTRYIRISNEWQLKWKHQNYSIVQLFSRLTSNKFISHRSFYFLPSSFFFLKTGQLDMEAIKGHMGCLPYDRSDHNDGMETYKSMTISVNCTQWSCLPHGWGNLTISGHVSSQSGKATALF